MTDDREFPSNDAERAWLDALRRESAPDAASEERLVAALEREGFFPGRSRVPALLLQLAAALVLFAAGAGAGAYAAHRGSLESALDAPDLTPAQATALLQRAAADYVKAADRAAVVAPLDPAAGRVAGEVLAGAAQAIVRARDAASSPASLVSQADNSRGASSASRPTLLWY